MSRLAQAVPNFSKGALISPLLTTKILRTRKYSN